MIHQNDVYGLFRGLILHREGIAQIELTAKWVADDIAYVKAVLDTALEEEERISIQKWLYPDGIDSEANFVAALNLRHSETGKWLLNSKAFESWINSKNDCIWLCGIGEIIHWFFLFLLIFFILILRKVPTDVSTAGCGKTVLS